MSREMIAAVDFIEHRTGLRMTTVPLYKGEDLWGTEILLRAERHMEIECMPIGCTSFRPWDVHNAGRIVVTHH